MGLEEAKAQYKRALSSLLYSCGLGDLSAIEDSVKTLDAAVCDVAIAVAQWVIYDTKQEFGAEDRPFAEINRLFGKVLEEPK